MSKKKLFTGILSVFFLILTIPFGIILIKAAGIPYHNTYFINSTPQDYGSDQVNCAEYTNLEYVRPIWSDVEPTVPRRRFRYGLQINVPADGQGFIDYTVGAPYRYPADSPWIQFTNEGQYRTRVRTEENVDTSDPDYEEVSAWSSPVCNIYYDITSPLVTITNPVQSPTNALNSDISYDIDNETLESIERLRIRLTGDMDHTLFNSNNTDEWGLTDPANLIGTLNLDLCDYNPINEMCNIQEGEYTLRVIALDKAGNERGLATQTLKIDRQAPQVTRNFSDYPLHYNPTTGNFVFRFTANDTGRGESRITGATAVDWNDETTPLGTITFDSPLDSHIETFVWDPTGLADGFYTIKLCASDEAGNNGEVDYDECEVLDIYIDTTAPTDLNWGDAWEYAANNGITLYTKQDDNIRVNWEYAGQDVVRYTYYTNYPDFPPFAAETRECSDLPFKESSTANLTDEYGNSKCTVNGNSVPVNQYEQYLSRTGNHTFEVTVKDLAGNENPNVLNGLTIYHDPQDPMISYLYSNVQNSTTNGVFDVTVNSEDNESGVKLINIQIESISTGVTVFDQSYDNPNGHETDYSLTETMDVANWDGQIDDGFYQLCTYTEDHADDLISDHMFSGDGDTVENEQVGNQSTQQCFAFYLDITGPESYAELVEGYIDEPEDDQDVGSLRVENQGWFNVDEFFIDPREGTRGFNWHEDYTKFQIRVDDYTTGGSVYYKIIENITDPEVACGDTGYTNTNNDKVLFTWDWEYAQQHPEYHLVFEPEFMRTENMHKLCYFAEDEAGNREYKTNYEIFKVDDTPPDISVTPNADDQEDNNGEVVYVFDESPAQFSTGLTDQGGNTIAGVRKLYYDVYSLYSVNDECRYSQNKIVDSETVYPDDRQEPKDWAAPTSVNDTVSVDLQEGYYCIKFESRDDARNKSEVRWFKLLIDPDDLAPVITAMTPELSSTSTVIRPGDEFEFDTTDTDRGDNDVVSFEITPSIGNVSANGQEAPDRTFTWTVSDADLGTYSNVRFCARDARDNIGIPPDSTDIPTGDYPYNQTPGEECYVISELEITDDNEAPIITTQINQAFQNVLNGDPVEEDVNYTFVVDDSTRGNNDIARVTIESTFANLRFINAGDALDSPTEEVAWYVPDGALENVDPGTYSIRLCGEDVLGNAGDGNDTQLPTGDPDTDVECFLFDIVVPEETQCTLVLVGGEWVCEEQLTRSTRYTHMRNHTQNDVPYEWIDPNWNDNWMDAYVIAENKEDGEWRSCNFIPDGGTAPSYCYNQDSVYKFFNKNFAQIISARPSVNTASMTRDFFRQQFNLVEGKQVASAKLYFTGDNVTKFWIDGNPIAANQNGNLTNEGVCDGSAQGNGHYGGSINMIDVTDKLNQNLSTHLIAGNILNTRPCGSNHPHGVQFYLWIQYTDGTIHPGSTNPVNPGGGYSGQQYVIQKGYGTEFGTNLYL
ncbi:hypothetical protein GF362_00745 [Candidatus Dojkabacteria bacterium]|nr:hypothetical protein [Candidatus Dojkabacteria bacterium]